jgi:PEP-CTERM motif-containing protein
MRNALFSGVGAVAFAGASALTIGMASPAMAGNIILTGHDNDFHCAEGDAGSACEAIAAEVSFVQAGSALPVLAIDAGTELSASLTAKGIAFTAVAPSAVTGSMFDHAKYSAFVVASVTSCGGCDNPAGTGTTLAGFEPQIVSFFNAGGGILGLAGAEDAAAYAYLPEAGGDTTPIFSSSGFVATAAGLANIPGFFAVNGDQTHNTFSDFASFYQVAETFGVGGPAVTLFGTGGTIKCTGTSCTIHGGVPEPSTWAMLGLGFFGLGMVARRKNRNAQLTAA